MGENRLFFFVLRFQVLQVLILYLIFLYSQPGFYVSQIKQITIN